MRRLVALVWVMLALMPLDAGPRPCMADGKVFAAGPAKVAIPDQEALIVWRDGVQTLAIETRFVGPGHDFAWVVPLPAKPEISPGTTGMFPTLRALCSPYVDNRTTGLWPVFLWIAVGLLIAMAGKTMFVRVVALLATCLAGVVFLIPTLGTARGGSVAGPAVEVLDRKVIGSFDVTTVASADPAAMSNWLTHNGFVVSPAADPVIADYIAKGWVFSAAKLRREEDTTNPSTPHPLVFKFPAKEPVYPLQLTAVDNGSLAVNLYVCGPSRAAADHFEVERCAAVKAVEAGGGHWGRPGDKTMIEVSHSGLAKLIGEGLTCTKLVATLTPSQMSGDAVIRFVDGGPKRDVVYTADSALRRSVDIGAGVFLAGVAIVALLSQKGPTSRATFRRVLGVLLVSLAAGGVTGIATATVETQGSGRDARRNWMALRSVSLQLWSDAYDYQKSGGRPDEAWVRARVKELLAEFNDVGPFEEGDGPGCYRFELSPEGEIDFRYYNAFGVECRYPI